MHNIVLSLILDFNNNIFIITIVLIYDNIKMRRSEIV